MRSLLITGGAGFIGANFVHYWRARYPDDRLVVLDALTYAGNRANLATLEGSPGFHFVRGNICEQSLDESLLREHAVDTVVHFAAESHVDRSIVGPGAFISTNILGTHALLEACRSVWTTDALAAQHRFHHISTDEVYGSLAQDDPAFTESTPYAPNSPYAASKAASDHLVRAYCHTYGLDTTITNCSNNYGPYQFPEKLIPLMIVNVLLGKPLPVYGDGGNVRDWIHVRDHCHAIERVLQAGRKGSTYNVGGDCELDNLSLVRMICEIMDRELDMNAGLCKRFPAARGGKRARSADLIKFVKDRPGHDRRYAINGRLIREELGFVPTTSLEKGLAETITWYLSNEQWWRAVMTGTYRNWIATNYSNR
ncbi:MAG: dTDP-glucose 4,6-dehydratase [Steroidobacteraceae bacterium]|nr:dTDP-glucose 4,6-dehydratase [Steroidobacteraceae bacterium]